VPQHAGKFSLLASQYNFALTVLMTTTLGGALRERPPSGSLTSKAEKQARREQRGRERKETKSSLCQQRVLDELAYHELPPSVRQREEGRRERSVKKTTSERSGRI